MNLHFALNPAWTDGFDLIRGHVEFNAEEQAKGLPASIDFGGLASLAPDFGSDEICLQFPKLDEGAFPGSDALCRRILIFTVAEEIEVLDEEITEPTYKRVAELFPQFFTEAHWEQVFEVYRLTRTHLAENCDLLDFESIPEVVEYHLGLGQPENDDLSLRDLFDFPLATGKLDGTRWFIDETYLPSRKSGPLVVNVEFRVTEDGLNPDLSDDQYEALNDDPEGHPEFYSPSVRLAWNLDSGEVTEVDRNKTDLPIARFLDFLLEVIPDARERFRRRHQHLVDSLAKAPAMREVQNARFDTDDDFQEFEAPGDRFNPMSIPPPPPGPAPIVRDAPKVGRNDPCPCGSGKKAKKCCGAS
jgi:hypothetical protein